MEAFGVSSYSVVNRTILPKGFTKTVAEDCWHLREWVQIRDVSCQRQVELKGNGRLRASNQKRNVIANEVKQAPDEWLRPITKPLLSKMRDFFHRSICVDNNGLIGFYSNLIALLSVRPMNKNLCMIGTA